MQTEGKNKSMQSSDVAKAAPTLQQFSFAGEGIYNPVTVEAETVEEAEKIWEKVRKTFNQ